MSGIDILHVHNLFPLITAGLLRASRDVGVPTVLTLHNFRLSCIAGTHFRAGRICEDCTDVRSSVPGVAHSCYRGSRIQSGIAALNQVWDREVWRELDGYFCLTDYMADRLVNEHGISRSRVTVRPTFVYGPSRPRPAGDRFVFIGRLTADKGIRILLDAIDKLDDSIAVDIVGDGPLAAEVSARVDSMAQVEFHGPLDRAGVGRVLEGAVAVLVPSLWYEGFPTVVSEAFSYGRPVIAIDNPNMSSVVGGCGWTCRPTPESLGDLIGRVAVGDLDVGARGHDARSRYEDEMTPSRSLEQLVGGYERAQRSVRS